MAFLDPYGLAFVESPLAEDDLVGHAALAARIATPVCLDESVTSRPSLRAALAAGALGVLNLKWGRVGGALEAVEILGDCASERVPVWIGGMLETGIGRRISVALAAQAPVSLPGDISGTRRFFEDDICPPLTVGGDGAIAVPRIPGHGAEVDPAAVSRLAVWRRWYPLSDG
jgi:O-succinylbenzoate synthase